MTMFLPPSGWHATCRGGQLLETRFPQTKITFIAIAVRSRHYRSSWTASCVAPHLNPEAVEVKETALEHEFLIGEIEFSAFVTADFSAEPRGAKRRYLEQVPCLPQYGAAHSRDKQSDR